MLQPSNIFDSYPGSDNICGNKNLTHLVLILNYSDMLSFGKSNDAKKELWSSKQRVFKSWNVLGVEIFSICQRREKLVSALRLRPYCLFCLFLFCSLIAQLQHLCPGRLLNVRPGLLSISRSAGKASVAAEMSHYFTAQNQYWCPRNLWDPD